MIKPGPAASGPPVTLREAFGLTLGPSEVAWSVNDAVTVALAAGMTPPEDLDYLYEGRGPRVLPTLAGVVCGSWFVPLLDRLGADRHAAVAGETRIELHRDFPPAGDARVLARIIGIDTRRSHARLVVEAAAEDAAGPVATVRTVTFLRGMGGEGWAEGEVEPLARCDAPEAPSQRRVRMGAPAASTAIYRLLFPLVPDVPYADAAHIDPSRSQRAGFAQPVLHALTVLGVAARAIALAGGPEARFRSLEGRYAGGAHGGTELQVDLWAEARHGWRAEVHDREGRAVLCGVRATLGGRAGA